MKTINIFGWGNGFNHFLRIDVLRQRQLNQNAVNRGVRIEHLNARKKLKLLHVGDYWYVDREDFLAYVLTPKRPGRPPKARPEGTDAR